MIRYDDNYAVDVEIVESCYIDGIYTTWYIEIIGSIAFDGERSRRKKEDSAGRFCN